MDRQAAALIPEFAANRTGNLMSSEKYLRTETVHIDEVSCEATSTIQWFAEEKNKKGSATHPITHNNKLSIHICGKEGFAAIAKDIQEAKGSIDLVCWGFDPGMELVRNGYNWPRAETYGDLLIAAGRRGVQVRVLVWYSYLGGKKQKHMPGHTHGTSPWRIQDSVVEVQQINAKRSLQLIQEHARKNWHKKEWNISGDKLAAMAREEYCCSWYKAAFAGRLEGITVRTRDGDADSIGKSLAQEAKKPDPVEYGVQTYGGTHHQKPVLIDFAYNDGQKAVGYVMGLNSLTDYWDTPEHCVENLLREQGAAKTKQEHAQGVEAYFDFETLKPYRDYACRIDGGRALIPLHENFERAWARAGGDPKVNQYVCEKPPSALLRKAISGDSTVQIVRTQPEEKDFTIKEIYFNATRVAAGGTGYLYMENQYFQYQEWAEHLLAIRKDVIAGWNRNSAKIFPGCCRQAGKYDASAVGRSLGRKQDRQAFRIDPQGDIRPAGMRCRAQRLRIQPGAAPVALPRDLYPFEIAVGRRWLFHARQRQPEPAQHGGGQ
jgi:phosphatidylserine/phosphatidylglycerophosphate/cardiolipin synthase-like enzyme